MKFQRWTKLLQSSTLKLVMNMVNSTGEKNIDITKGNVCFFYSNQMLKAVPVQLREGKGAIEHHPPMWSGWFESNLFKFEDVRSNITAVESGRGYNIVFWAQGSRTINMNTSHILEEYWCYSEKNNLLWIFEKPLFYFSFNFRIPIYLKI